MVKLFCDHCLTEIAVDEPRRFVSSRDVYGNYHGPGKDLCEKCWRERELLHAQLDRQFFRLDKEDR